MVLLRYAIETVCDYGSFRELLYKRLRWIVVMRHMRRWGHLGLLFTQGLPLALLAVAVHPSKFTAVAYLGSYILLRSAMAWTIGIRGLRLQFLWREIAPNSRLGCGCIRHMAD